MSAFPPASLRDYALIADGERGALCGPNGELVWLCAPQWHDDAVLSALLGGRGGYAVTPLGRYVWGGHYETGTLIWRNRWVTDTGAMVDCRDALALPADPRTVVVLRCVEGVAGDLRMRVVLDVRAAFGHEPMRDLHEADGTWTARTGPLQLRWRGAPAARVEDGHIVTEFDIREGDRHELVLEIGPSLADPPRSDWATTERAWHEAVPPFDASVAPRDAQHAYAVLRGLTSAGNGMVAAATMSLPEREGAGANYDYRYAWIRDQCVTGQAIAADGPHELLRSAVEFVTARLLDAGPKIVPAYLVNGGPIPDEQPVDLPGYPGGSSVRGNAVARQFQLDTMGEILQLLAAADRHDMLDADGRRAVGVAVDVIEDRWQRPDSGIWELDDEWWTHSRLSCVAGLRQVHALATKPEAQRLRGLGDAILAETTRRCTHPEGYWQRCPDDQRVDAALLLPGIRGAEGPHDQRTRATLAAVRQRLVQDGYVYRYAPEDADLGENEGAFLFCGFLLALAEAKAGNAAAAFRAFERNRAACGPPGLLSEEFDVQQRQLRGNVPQAFVHALLLESAVRLADCT